MHFAATGDAHCQRPVTKNSLTINVSRTKKVAREDQRHLLQLFIREAHGYENIASEEDFRSREPVCPRALLGVTLHPHHPNMSLLE